MEKHPEDPVSNALRDDDYSRRRDRGLHVSHSQRRSRRLCHVMEQEPPGTAETAQKLLHLATLQAGDFFGEQALLTNESRNATIIALAATGLLRFSKPELTGVVKSYPRVGAVLHQAHRQRETNMIASLKSALQKFIAC